MAVLDCIQIVEVVLTHVYFQLSNFMLGSGDSKQSFLFHVMLVFDLSKVSRQEPEN